MDKIKKEEDDEEVELSDYVEHDKNYFFVHLAEISCKLCDFKGKLIVQHYRAKHPESEVLISRIDPDITQILIEDAEQNREEYNKTHPKLKTKRNFKCPFCLVIFNIIPNSYYNHISSHTGEYRFRCNHCSYWTYNDVKMRTHLNETHYKIHKRGYKKVYPDPEILKYVFGYICSECNFIQLIRATVEEHAMVYHPGKPEIHRVNLGILLHSNEKKVTELSILSSQVEELEEVKSKVQPEVLGDDLHPLKKSLRTYVNTRKAKMKESEKVHLKNNEPENTSEEVKKQNENVKPFEQLEEAKKSVEAFENSYNSSITNELQKQLTPLLTFQDVFSNVLEIGPISVTKESNIFTFHCKIQNCNYASEDQKAFATHCEVIHNDFVYIFGTEECSVCSIKFEYKGKFVTVHDVYLHIVTVHNNFFKPKSIPLTPPKYDCNLSELVKPYNCEDDGFPSCPFKTLYFDEYLKHVAVIHQVNGLDSFSSERESPREAIMEGWLTKEVGPFQCKYCKKATVTHQEMTRHQAVFHTQKQCWFYYRKFVPNDTVIIPEQVNLEDPSFINHVIHLPDQVHLCDFKLKDDLLSSTSTELNRVSKALLPLLPEQPLRNPENDSDPLKEPLELDEVFSILSDDVAGLLDESDLLCLNDEVPKVQKKLQCKWEDCYQTYLSQTALVNHIEKDHVKFQRCCFWNNCPRKSEPYSSTHHLLMHMRVHTGEKPNKCPFPGCDRAFSKMQTLKVHQRSHTGERPYLCQFPNCLRSFSDSSHRSKHMRTHDIKLYACQVTGCPKKYTNPNSLRTHVKNHTVDEQLEIKRKLVENKQKSYYAQKKLSSSSDTTGDEMKHHNICEWEGCFRTFHSQMALVEHIEKNHIELKGGEEFTCFWNNCARELKPYSTRQNLLFHMRIHSGEKPNKCEFQGCKEAFTRLEALKIHQRKHTGERPYLCQFTNCFKSFTCSTHRSKHMRTHYDTKPYACKVIGCSKRYAYSSNLWTHMFTHTIDEQLEVKRKTAENKQKEGHFVQKRVYKSSDRVKQQRTQHYIKSYICQAAGCSSRFGYPSKLWKHMKTHTVNDQLEFKRKSVENKQGKNLSFILYQI